MKKSLKAALWSVFGFPGLGHLVLKHYHRAAFYMVPAAICLFWYTRNLIIKAQSIVDQITAGTISLDAAGITDALNNVPESTSANIAFWGFVICWVVSIIDAFQLGLAQEAEDATKDGGTRGDS